MSRPYRRPRGTPTIALNLFVAPDVKEKIDTWAANANVPIWAIVEAAVRAGVPDENGVPDGWEIPGHDTETLPGLGEGGSSRKTA